MKGNQQDENQPAGESTQRKPESPASQPEKKYPVRVLLTGFETATGTHARGNTTYLTQAEIAANPGVVEPI